MIVILLDAHIKKEGFIMDKNVKECPLKWSIRKIEVKGNTVEVKIKYFLKILNQRSLQHLFMEDNGPISETMVLKFKMKDLLRLLKKSNQDLDKLLQDKFLLPNVIKQLGALAEVTNQRIKRRMADYYYGINTDMGSGIRASKDNLFSTKEYFETACRAEVREWARIYTLMSLLMNPVKYGLIETLQL